MRAKKFLVRLLCCIIPVATWRRAVRAALTMPRGAKYMNEAEFAKYVNGKTVAVVGNGPQQIGKNTGAEIDSADIVVRFNTFDLTNHTDDYGTRTDVWANGCAGNYDDDRYLDIAKKCKYVIWRYSPVGLNNQQNILNFFDRCRRANIKIHIFPHKRLNQCTQEYPEFDASYVGMTTGFQFLWYLKKHMQPKQIKIYGFSFTDKSIKQQDLEKMPHFYHKDETGGKHNMSIETSLLRKLFAGELK
jgi:hypothetical protein